MYKIYNEPYFELINKMPKNYVDLIVMDPPHNIDVKHDGGDLLRDKIYLQELSNENNDLTIGYDIEKVNSMLVDIMKDINIYIWCSKSQIIDYLNFYVTKLQCKFDILCYHKTNPVPTFSNKYVSDTEYLLYFHNGTGKCFPKNIDDAKTYYTAPINLTDKLKYRHPTIKPLPMIEKIIRNSSKENQIVFDPFMGSGTTGVACRRLNRDFIGCETYKYFYDIAKRRIKCVPCKLF